MRAKFKGRKIRYRQIDRAIEMQQHPDKIADYDDEDGCQYIIFIPAGHEDEYKKLYGNRLKIWWEE